jgi:protein SCO1
MAIKSRSRAGIGRLPLIAGALVLALAALAAILPAMRSETPRANSLAGIGGPFTLVSETGRTVSDRDFRGKWLLLYFGYTHCPDACPTALNTIAEAVDHLDPNQTRIQPLFITLDPERDTPAQLGTYTAAFASGIIGLTGTPAQIAAAAKQYHIAYAKHPLPGGSDYGIDHTSIIVLVDPTGSARAIFPDQIPPDRLIRRLDETVG